MARLLDANVLLRWMLRDKGHPMYDSCLRELNVGGTVTLYVLPEIVYAFVGSRRRETAYRKACLRGEKDKFNQNPRKYLATVDVDSGWHKEAAQGLRARIVEALLTFPNLKFQYWDLVEVALGRMVETGHDCVDCLLYAESILGGHEVVSIDKHLSDVSKVPAHAASRSIGKMDLR